IGAGYAAVQVGTARLWEGETWPADVSARDPGGGRLVRRDARDATAKLVGGRADFPTPGAPVEGHIRKPSARRREPVGRAGGRVGQREPRTRATAGSRRGPLRSRGRERQP